MKKERKEKKKKTDQVKNSQAKKTAIFSTKTLLPRKKPYNI